MALRALGAPLFLDDAGTPAPLGVEYAATAADGTRVRITRLAPALGTGLRDRDAFVDVLERYRYEGAGIAGDALYFVERPPEGEPLSARLAREGTIRPTAFFPIASSAAEALAEYHRTHDAHGGLCPRTIYVRGDSEVLLRWGGVVPALIAAGAGLEAISERLGLTGYLAPELARSADFDVPSDIFALGATFYAVTTGRPPFGGRTTAGVMATVLTEDATTKTSPAQLLTTAVLRSVEQEPADRWRDAHEFARAIRGMPEPTAPATPRTGCLGAVTVISTLVVWGLTKYIT
ncbi:MAG: hypothetical protein HOQ09_09420 [Gemmatimonadaceae bacterium]|nr:hypothetical protein [Gemmatimonadaceae bacterium]